MSSPPSTLGQYQVIREIARSNDIVYEGYDPLMNRRVAIKELAMPAGASTQQQEERLQRFRREAQAAGTLNHPNIMTVYSFAEDAGRTFMAMEFLDGHTLRNEIDTKGIIPMNEAIRIATDILHGLAHAHKKGVIHRDIKPENIQILSNGEIKITDFGIARLTFQPNLTMDGQVFGTPSYMSPEQVVGKEIDARSDVFSLGVVLYEMIAGQKPFAGDSVVSITYAIMNKEASQPSQMPYRLWQTVQRALEKAPVARWDSADAFIVAIEEAMQSGNADPGNNPYLQHGLSPSTSSFSVPPPVIGVPNPYAQNPHPVHNPGIVNQPYNQGQPKNPYAAPPPLGGYTQQPYGAAAYPGANYPGASYPGATYPGATYPGATYPGANYPNTSYPGQTQAPYGQTSMPPPGPLPNYFPPPPRRPLVSPETAAFFKRLFLTFLLVGTVLALVTVAVQAIATAWQRYAAEDQDRQLIVQARQQDTRIPVEERIQTLEGLRSRVQSDTMKDEIKRNLAVLYEELGRKHIANKQDPQAESAYIRASALDKNNSALASNLASLYQTRALAESQPAQRIVLLNQSGEQWEIAGKAEPNAQKRTEYLNQAALLYFTAATETKNLGDPSQYSRARQTLYAAQRVVTPQSDLASQIQSLLTTLQ